MSTASRVNRGVKYLDKHEPDWVDKIVRPVDLNSGTDCLLGQVFGSFQEQLRKPFLNLPYVVVAYALAPLSMVWCIRRGFFAGDEAGDIVLEDEWNSVIFERRFDEFRCQMAAARIKEYEASLNKEKVSA